jgi:hypothetical protein
VAFSQNKDKKMKTRKLSKDEKASMTQEQVLAHENDRLTKGGKKKMSTKQKAKVQRKQARAAKNTKVPQSGARSKPRN